MKTLKHVYTIRVFFTDGKEDFFSYLVDGKEEMKRYQQNLRGFCHDNDIVSVLVEKRLITTTKYK